MAYKRTVSSAFWTDSKIVDSFTPEDKYFYLYLFTNPLTNLCGCYEISIRQMSNDTGYNKETIERLLERFEKIHKVACYSFDTKEVLLVNWNKHNWTTSEKYVRALENQISNVKNEGFREFLYTILQNEDTVSIPYTYPIDTAKSSSSSDTNTSNTITPNTNTSNTKNIYIDTINKYINERNYSEYISNIVKEWFLYKKERGQSYKPMGITKLLNKIDKVLLDHTEQELIDLINECMERNYQGIIWDLLDKKKNSGSGSAYMDAIKNRVSVVDEWV